VEPERPEWLWRDLPKDPANHTGRRAPEGIAITANNNTDAAADIDQNPTDGGNTNKRPEKKSTKSPESAALPAKKGKRGSASLQNGNEDPGARLGPSRRRFIDTADIYDIPSVWSDDFAGLNWIFESLLLDRGVSGLAGPSGCGKSSLVTALAAHIVRGESFLNLKVQQRPVLIADRQNSLGGVQDRLTRLGIKPHRDLIFLGGWGGDDVPGIGSDSLLRAVKRTPGLVIIFDSLEDFLEGDENSNRDMGQLMRQARRLANAGASVLLIHHPGRTPSIKDWFRGAQIFKDQLDCAAFLTNRTPEAGVEQLGSLTLTFTKSRAGGRHPLKFNFRNGIFVLSHKPALESEDLQSKIEQIIRENPRLNGAKFDKLALAAGLKRQPARDQLDKLVDSGAVSTEDLLPRGSAYRWNGDE
jgi:hypothetical protein